MSLQVCRAVAALVFVIGPMVASTVAQEIGPPRTPGEQRYYPGPGWVDPGIGQRPGVVYAGRSLSGAPRYCLKMCEQDMNPCDPIEYKRADMRCSAEGNR